MNAAVGDRSSALSAAAAACSSAQNSLEHQMADTYPERHIPLVGFFLMRVHRMCKMVSGTFLRPYPHKPARFLFFAAVNSFGENCAAAANESVVFGD